MHLTKCDLTMMLKMAKAAHSKLPKAVTDDPHHSWEAWYADWMLARMTELDLTETFNHLPEPPIGIHNKWEPTNGNGPAPTCPPGPAQECSDVELYSAPASDNQDVWKASPPSPASGWR